MPAATTLTAKQARFADEYLVDSNGAAAAVRAGYAPGSAKVAASRLLTSDNPVRRAIQARQDADSERLGVSRQEVLAGLLTAVSDAREQRNPMAMISGLREIGRMLGFYAVETKRVEVSAEGQGAMRRLESLSDAELLEVIAAAGPAR
jgi:phage terminase small subunit